MGKGADKKLSIPPVDNMSGTVYKYLALSLFCNNNSLDLMAVKVVG